MRTLPLTELSIWTSYPCRGVLAWRLRHARAHQFRIGYVDQAAEVWGSGAGLLGVTHQIVCYEE
jgi:hypothetical protein